MRIGDWSSDVCSSDREAGLGAFVTEALGHLELAGGASLLALARHGGIEAGHVDFDLAFAADVGGKVDRKAVGVIQREQRSEEHTSELQSLMRISYAVFCLKKKRNTITK